MFNFIFMLVLTLGRICAEEMELKLVHLIWRHGDRNPVLSEIYPKDPYRDSSFWPDGHGQLTNIGIKQQQELGQFFRAKYIKNGFLEENFDPKKIYVESSNVNRTVMSAVSNFMGFYGENTDYEGSHNSSIGNLKKSFNIPISLIPKDKDNKLMLLSSPCPRWSNSFDSILNDPSSSMKQAVQKQQWMFEYVSNNSGAIISNLVNLTQFYDILYIQHLKNFTLPEWTKAIFPGKDIEQLSALSFKALTYTDEMKRFRGGPLMKEIIRHMEDHIHGKSRYRKLYAYSGHDLTIVSLLDILGVFKPHQPKYASALMIELKRNRTGSYFVDVLYRNDTTQDPYVLHPPACPQMPCDFQIFKTSFKKFLPDNWAQECNT